MSGQRTLMKAFRTALAGATAQAEMHLEAATKPGTKVDRYVATDFELPDGTRLQVTLFLRVDPSDRNARGQLLLNGPAA